MIYLDHNSTTPLDPSVWQAMQEAAALGWANPGSRHAAGRKARQLYDDAKQRMADLLDCHWQELIITSGGTESINLAMFGFAHARGEKTSFAIPPGEHPATVRPAQILASQGLSRQQIAVSQSGELLVDHLDTEQLAFVSTLLANNETGLIYNLSELSHRCQIHHVPLHVDAVQAVGKIPVSFAKLDVAAMSFAAHKFCGPRGVGGLILKSATPLSPVLYGGFQEQGLRPGTELVVLTVGMAAALELATTRQAQHSEQISQLRDEFEMRLQRAIPRIVIHAQSATRLPNTSNIAFPVPDGDALLVMLDLQGVCCSMGSACASGSSEPSPALLALGVSPDQARRSLRFSFGRGNTFDEVEQTIDIISRSVQQLSL